VPALSLSPPSLSALEFQEPVLTPNPHRYTLFPVQKPKLYAKYKEHMSTFWVPEEVDLSMFMKD